jgi:hypothetical protein
MALTTKERTALREVEKAINVMRRHYDSIDPAVDFDGKMEAGETYRKLVNLQAQLLQSAMDREIPLDDDELKAIEQVGDAIQDAAKKQQRVKLAARLVAMLALK